MGGFNLPPGVTVSMLPGNEPVSPCEVCGGDPDALVDAPNGCICPDCPECGAHGDPECYEKHGLVRTEGQTLNRAKYEAEQQEEMNRDILATFAEAQPMNDTYESLTVEERTCSECGKPNVSEIQETGLPLVETYARGSGQEFLCHDCR